MRTRDREKFVELANKRVNSAIKTVRLIGNLSNKTNYFYTENDVKEIFNALNRELKDCQKRFEAGSSNNELVFKLKV